MRVDSSWITDVFYFGEDRILRIVLKNKLTYDFSNISLDIWVDLVNASKNGDSIGHFICTRIMATGELEMIKAVENLVKSIEQDISKR